MNLLFFGDIVGAQATDLVISSLPAMRAEYQVDVVIANAENCAPSGLGMTVKQADLLLEAGVDIITGGNHSWDTPESVDALDHPRVLRPLNLADGVPGHGIIRLDLEAGPLTVLNLADPCAMKSVRAAAGKYLPAYPAWLAAERAGTVLVDYHGDHVIEKQIFARAVDGEAAAVLGTHTHEPTTPLHILPGGTALVTDVGMTGPAGGVQGFAYDSFVAGLKTVGNPFALPLPAPIEGPLLLGAVLLTITGQKTTGLRRITDWPAA